MSACGLSVSFRSVAVTLAGHPALFTVKGRVGLRAAGASGGSVYKSFIVFERCAEVGRDGV
jgi:hypothetical protein